MRAKESNEINNKELKENIANVAIGLLEEGSDYNELAYTKVEFGYLFCCSRYKYDETQFFG